MRKTALKEEEEKWKSKAIMAMGPHGPTLANGVALCERRIELLK